MPINKIVLKIPAGAKALLNNPQSMFYQRMQGAINAIAITIQGNVKRNIIPAWNMGFQTRMPFFTGKLNRSITFETSGLKARIGSNMVYAAIQEYGGDIVPVRAKALFIPMSAQGRKVGAVKGGGSGLKYGEDFIFKQKVTIKPKSYFQRGMETSIDKIMNILDVMLQDLGKKGGLK